MLQPKCSICRVQPSTTQQVVNPVNPPPFNAVKAVYDRNIAELVEHLPALNSGFGLTLVSKGIVSGDELDDLLRQGVSTTERNRQLITVYLKRNANTFYPFVECLKAASRGDLALLLTLSLSL